MSRILDGTESILSGNRITIDVTDEGCIEITFESHDGNTSWGESLPYEDSLYLAGRLGGRNGFNAAAAAHT